MLPSGSYSPSRRRSWQLDGMYKLACMYKVADVLTQQAIYNHLYVNNKIDATRSKARKRYVEESALCRW